MHSAGLRRAAAAFVAINLALVLFALAGSAAWKAGAASPLDVQTLASAVAQANIVLSTLGAFLIVVAGQGGRRALVLLGLSLGIGGATEWASLTTGWPYGRYTYTGLLGPALGGRLPVLIPFAWFVGCATALVIARQLASNAPAAVAVAAALVVLWDLVLDPAMTVGFAAWQWADYGPYYGIPLRNFAAWGVIAAAIVAAYLATTRGDWRTDDSPLALSLYFIQGLLPAGLAALHGRIGAAAVWSAGVGMLCAASAWRARRKEGVPRCSGSS